MSTSADGISVVFDVEDDLSDSEFRLLVLLCDYPYDGRFRVSLDVLESRGMEKKAAYQAAKYLSEFPPDGTDFSFEDPTIVSWRVCK